MAFLRVSVVALAAVSFAALPLAARADADWQKTYPVSGKPSLTFFTGDTSAEVHSCGDCREIRIRVEWNDRHASDYNLSEFQSGGHVNFELHEKPGFGFHMQFGNRHSPHVTFETPAALDLEARTGDGSLKVYGVQGDLQLRTSDGSMDVSDVSGALRIQASDGSIHVHNASGTLESHSSDGSVHIDGRFSGVQVRTSDGSLELNLNEGSQLTTASSVEASDGRVVVRVPKSLAADLEIHTGDGHFDCDLPLVMNGYNSHGGGHDIRGHLNAGGVPFTIHTHDGNVTVTSL
ncbi:MAG TPA: DUF4097 family beta strand repeat-containing protein [Terracidiphilus sp.]|jgi:hypothetical protein|nr:DUF4097 family beta strand repeat-containing protein [Terracidiphilus sp.]